MLGIFRGSKGHVWQAYAWTLLVAVVAVVVEIQAHIIEDLGAHPERYPLTWAEIRNICSIEWPLIFTSVGALIGSFLENPTEKNRGLLLWPVVSVSGAILATNLMYGLLPSVGAGAAVGLTATGDIIGAGILYYCITSAEEMRTQS
jgi:hypothetical protein